MSVLQYPEAEMVSPKEVHMWVNAAFDNGESDVSVDPLSINLSHLLDADLSKENQSPSMAESQVSLKGLAPIKPLNKNNFITNAQINPISDVGILVGKIVEKEGQENFVKERNLDCEIKEIEEEIVRLSSRLEGLRLEKVKRNEKAMEKRGRIVAAKFMDPPKQNTKMWDERSNIEESLCMSGKLRTPRRGVSMGPAEIMRGARRGISLGPMEIYSATKLKQLGKQEISTPIQTNSNRRKSCYWKLNEIDELRATKERGKSLSVSPRSRCKGVSKMQVPKQAATTIGSRKTVKKEDGVISSIQPKKLFVKDGEKSAGARKSLKSGRVVSSRCNQMSNGGGSALKELRKRSLPENEGDCNRCEKKRASLVGKSQGAKQPGTESRVNLQVEIPSAMEAQKGSDHKNPSSVSKILDMVPRIRTLRCMNESPRDSGAVKRVAELVGRKSYFNMDSPNDDEVEESVCQALEFVEEEVTEECPKIRVMRCSKESPRDSGAAKRVSQLVGKKSFFDVHHEMPMLGFEEEEVENN